MPSKGGSYRDCGGQGNLYRSYVNGVGYKETVQRPTKDCIGEHSRIPNKGTARLGALMLIT